MQGYLGSAHRRKDKEAAATNGHPLEMFFGQELLQSKRKPSFPNNSRVPFPSGYTKH